LSAPFVRELLCGKAGIVRRGREGGDQASDAEDGWCVQNVIQLNHGFHPRRRIARSVKIAISIGQNGVKQ
jgi:hypothetical protein